MSIVTRTGDQGTTSLMYNRRVSKSDPHVEACGSVDELSAALGLARATATGTMQKDSLASIQRDLIALMGELATATEDLKRYVQDGYPVITPEMTRKLEDWVTTVEQHQPDFRGWATPGANLHSAALDMARTICRRAERRVCDLLQAGQVQNTEIIVYLNRLSDLLWLVARQAENAA